MKLASQEKIQTALKHLKQRENSANTFELESLASYLQANKQTTSQEFNAYLINLVAELQEPQQPVALTEQEEKNAKLQRILQEICNQPKFNLSYQGVNPATAINMKLAVNLAALIKEEKHV